MQEYQLQRAPLRPHRTPGKKTVSGATDVQRKALGLPPAASVSPASIPPPPRKPVHASRRR